MKSSKLIGAVAFLFISGTFAFAQQPDELTVLGKLNRAITVLNAATRSELPQRIGAWKLQVFSKEGILNYQQPDLILTSDGLLSKRRAAALKFNPESLRPLSQIISNFQMPATVQDLLPQPLAQLSKISICKNCQATSLVLSRRDADGAAKTFSTTWDEKTRAETSKDILQIYEAFTRLIEAK